MVKTFYRGKPLCNALSAITKWFPYVSGGKSFDDVVKGLSKDKEALTGSAAIDTFSTLYAAYRLAADPTIRETAVDDIKDEIEFFDLQDTDSEFFKALLPLIFEKGKLSQKHSKREEATQG